MSIIKPMNVLVACEYSGTVRDAFARLGHNALSCDLLETDVPGNHYKGNVMDVINDGWDLMIAHPPCTFLTNSGVCHLHKDPKRWIDLFDGADFFNSLLNSDIPKIAVENPIMHKYAKRLVGVNQSQVIQPWMFGHTEQKATCLWLKNLPLLKQTNNVKDEMMLLSKAERQRIYYKAPSKDRWKFRSTTFAGVADAMAKQWGGRCDG